MPRAITSHSCPYFALFNQILSGNDRILRISMAPLAPPLAGLTCRGARLLEPLCARSAAPMRCGASATSRGDRHSVTAPLALGVAYRNRESALEDLPSFMAAMTAYFSSVIALGKRPSAFVPIAMSVAALLMVLASIAASGVDAGQNHQQ